MMRPIVALAAFWLVISCATVPPQEEIRATVTQVDSVRALQGDILNFVTLEFRDLEGVLVRQRVRVGTREWVLFGREGREVCLHRHLDGWRLDPCR